jgi:exodeoxyribonuclease X
MPMKKIIFLDTETTGTDLSKDFLCQLAFKTDDEVFCELYKPPVSIPPEASAVTHITDKHVENQPTFTESKEYGRIKALLEDPSSIMVAHNAKFDVGMIQKESITPYKYICTLRVARALDTKGVLSQYKLQYLRYYLGIEIEAQAHDALGDVLVLEKLFERLLEKVKKEYDLDTNEALEKMIELSSLPSMMRIFTFGKYNGKSCSEVLSIDRGYLEWMLVQKEQNPDNEEDWIYTLRFHLGKLQ